MTDGDDGLLSGIGDIGDPRQLRELLDAVLVVGRGLDLEAVLQRIVDVAARVLDARYCALAVRAEHSGLLTEFVHTGIDDATRATMDHLPVGHGVLGVVFDDPRVLRIRDLGTHPASIGLPPNHPPMRTFLGAPILVRGNVFGSIYLTEKQSATEFSRTDEALVGVLAVAAGIAVDNARLFELTRSRQRWVEVLARRGSEPLAGIALTDTMNGLCSDVADLTGAAGVAVITGNGGQDRERGAHGAPVAGAGWVVQQSFNAGKGPSGRLALAYDTDPHLAPEIYAGLAGVAEIASLAIAYDERQQMARDLEVLADRHRIARDLHDHVIQRLFAIGIALQTMSMTAGAGAPVDLGDRLATVIGDLDATVAQIRTSIFDLQTTAAPTSSTGVRRRVLDIVEQLATHTRVTPAVRFGGAVDTVVPDVLTSHLEAVVREALSNAFRHAGADRIDVVVAVTDEDLVVTVSDDGRGIAADANRRGLRNLADRAVECGGAMTLVTPTGGGTELKWVVPLEQ